MDGVSFTSFADPIMTSSMDGLADECLTELNKLDQGEHLYIYMTRLNKGLVCPRVNIS